MFLLVSVRHVGAHPGAHLGELQHGVSIQISISLGKTFLRISRIRNIPLSWILARVFVYVYPGLCICSWALENFSHSRGLRTDISQKTVVGCPWYVPPFISQILDFIYWTVLIFTLIYFEWRNTENQQYLLSHLHFLNYVFGKNASERGPIRVLKKNSHNSWNMNKASWNSLLSFYLQKIFNRRRWIVLKGFCCYYSDVRFPQHRDKVIYRLCITNEVELSKTCIKCHR